MVAHCGYLGVSPKAFSTQWTLRPKVLAIVDDNATAIDARLPTGHITLVKVHPFLDRILMVEGDLEDYVRYPGSDCRNGAVIRVPNGYRLMDALYSHHQVLVRGHWGREIRMLAEVLDMDIEEA